MKLEDSYQFPSLIVMHSCSLMSQKLVTLMVREHVCVHKVKAPKNYSWSLELHLPSDP